MDASAAGLTLTNTALANSEQTDPVTGTNIAILDTVVSALATLSIVKTATPDPAVPGEALTYEIMVSNAGPSDAAGEAGR